MSSSKIQIRAQAQLFSSLGQKNITDMQILSSKVYNKTHTLRPILFPENKNIQPKHLKQDFPCAQTHPISAFVLYSVIWQSVLAEQFLLLSEMHGDNNATVRYFLQEIDMVITKFPRYYHQHYLMPYWDLGDFMY